MLRDATSRARRRQPQQQQQQRRRRRQPAAVGGIRLPNLAYLALAAVLALATAAAAIGPPTNSLRLFIMYEISWIEPQTGQFGANITFFRSAGASPAPGWGTVMTFRNRNAAVENFWNTQQFAVAADGRGNIKITNKEESLPDGITPDLVASDTAKGLKRMSLFVNGRLSAPAVLTDLTPTAFWLTMPNETEVIQLVDQLDFSRTPVTGNLPRKPFGPFLQSVTAALADSEKAAAEPVPSPKGTDLVATLGLWVFTAVFVIAGTAFTIGTIDKMNAASDFRKQSGMSVDSRNQFMQ